MRYRKGVNLDGGKELGGTDIEETTIRIYYVKKSIFNKKGGGKWIQATTTGVWLAGLQYSDGRSFGLFLTMNLLYFLLKAASKTQNIFFSFLLNNPIDIYQLYHTYSKIRDKQ